jgi:hypothetical protein
LQTDLQKERRQILNEYPHGFEGFRFLCSLFKSYEDIIMAELLDSLANGKGSRTDKCYCCSGIKYKKTVICQ